MLCAQCGQREATIHEVVIDAQGQKVEKHLCEQCAARAGVDDHPHVPISQLLSTFVVAGPAGGGAAGQACPGCGTTFAEFRRTGLLGCERCYAAFEGRLGPLLARAHEGATHHLGKSPRRASGGEGASGAAADRTERLALLRRQLAEAVRGERYERAAEIKAEIERVAAGEGPEGAVR